MEGLFTDFKIGRKESAGCSTDGLLTCPACGAPNSGKLCESYSDPVRSK